MDKENFKASGDWRKPAVGPGGVEVITVGAGGGGGMPAPAAPLGPQKAVQAGGGSALSIILLWLLARWLDFVEPPPMHLLQEAVAVVVASIITGLGVAWRTWIVPNLPRRKRAEE